MNNFLLKYSLRCWISGIKGKERMGFIQLKDLMLKVWIFSLEVGVIKTIFNLRQNFLGFNALYNFLYMVFILHFLSLTPKA
ncbi:hypothetical protein CQA62_04795 [Helicobacter cholecystus]|uniref:Uncharacterized protein n=1 Tax=Helicobacter cholecystus TaxID=45498 RepID=A0A3D8IVC3_9HELI|nr:hypothetical protein [Helicobacter cholecystus]RDU68926.1 hypothetical protein CQA62_04795 [Helicobacter cholecystus]VEJ25908.1 Uncharacterised protein [Helicobacter cholecystus]